MTLSALIRVATLAIALVFTAQARAEQSPDAALDIVLRAAREAARTDCAQPGIDGLIRILCSGHMRVGVHNSYPLFSTLKGGEREGYEIDVARAIAKRLGVEAEFIKVDATTRIPMLADAQIDLAIATMGHNTQRDGQARFIRPHYYRSETVLIAPRDMPISGWDDIERRTVCATVGNGSNAELVSHGARLMLFDEASMLPDLLADGTCTLAAQDDSFFASYFLDPHFAGRFAAKFGFTPVPWGIGVAPGDSERLARALDLMSQIFLRDGVFLEIARANHIGTAFLKSQRAVWARPECNTENGSTNTACILQPFDNAMEPTAIAGQVAAFERWVFWLTNFDLQLPMLKTAPAWSMFMGGVVNSLMLIAGALGATLGIAILFGAMAGSRFRLLRWPVRAITIALQSSPIVLTLVIVSAVMHALVPYSSMVALSAAMLALGLANGSNAGQAISEALLTLRAERADIPTPPLDLFARALNRSATQIAAFLINAAKGTPIASFIGAPELLSALTDISSFSSGRVTTYSLLLVFYTAVVILVVWLCHRVQAALERSQAAA